MSTAEQAYRESATRHLRDELILAHVGLVRESMGRLVATLPQHIDRDQLESAGMVGLLQAAEKYEPSKGEFKPFAKQRIRGAMIDELRRESGVSQEMLARIKRVETARQACTPPATLDQIARRAGLAEQQVIDAMDAARWTRIEEGLPLDQLLIAGETRIGGQSNGERCSPLEHAANAELRDALTDAIANLEDRERLIVTMYHLEEMTLAEIGEVLGIHPGNVGRALTVAQHKLGERLRAHAQA